MLAGVLYVVLLVARHAVQRRRLERAGQRPRAAARDSIQLLPQAVPRRSWPAPSSRCSSSPSPSAPISPRSCSRGADEAAARTVTTAQRLVEDYAAYAAIQPRGSGGAWRGRRSDHGARRRAPSTRTSTCSNAHACRRRARAISSRRSCSRRGRRRRLSSHPARPAADLRRRRGRRRGAAIGSRRRRCGPAAATASSPCR